MTAGLFMIIIGVILMPISFIGALVWMVLGIVLMTLDS